MPYNDNQLFYAALYWAEALPGGQAFTDDICKKHGKPYMPMNAPQQTLDKVECECNPFEDDEDEFFLKEERVKYKVESGVSRGQCETFFDAMYGFLREGKEKEKDASNSKDGKFLQLCRSNVTSKSHFPFSDAIEAGLAEAGLDREILNPHAFAFAHDNGALISMQAPEKNFRNVIDVAYIGRPQTGYRSLPSFGLEESAKVISTAQIEYFYRQIPLKAGQAYTWGYNTVGGGHEAHDEVAQEGEFFMLSHRDVDGDLGALSDDEILNGDARVTGGCAYPKNEWDRYQPGYFSEKSGVSVEATDDPCIVRELQYPMPCMDVTEKIQISYGRNFQLAEPGDKIVFDEKDKRVMLFRKEEMGSGKSRLAVPKAKCKPSNQLKP